MFLSGLDARTRNVVDETRGLLQTFKAIEAAERDKLETRLAAQNEQQNIIRDQKLVRAVSRVKRDSTFASIQHTRTTVSYYMYKSLTKVNSMQVTQFTRVD